MTWLTSLFLLLAMTATIVCASIAVFLSRRVSALGDYVSAEIASVSGALSRMEKSERLTPSMLAELADVKDAIEKGNALLKKVNSREVMRARRENGEIDGVVTKEELRRRAGLIAGKPAPHA